METKKYPFRYFVFLVVALILAILFWLFVFSITHNIGPAPERSSAVTGDNQRTGGHWNPELLPEGNGQIVPVDTSKIIADTLNKRKIVSNIVNIAVKNASGSILSFANDLKKHYPSDAYKIIYIDSVINRLQVKLPDNERVTFKNEVKNKVSNYNILVWDEILFDYVKNFNDPKLRDKDASWYLKATNIEKYWDKTTGDPNIVIAVVDNGFDLSHPELIGKSVKPYNVIDKSSDVSPGPINHGTHVASVIVANQNNNQGIVGVCSSCMIMPIKVEDQNGRMSNSYVIDAILYAIKNKAAVVNLSLGMFMPGNVSIPSQAQQNYINSNAKDEEQFWNDLFDYADKNNVTCVLAAGNSNILTGFDPFQRAKNTIKVGAIGLDLIKAQFSNYGPNTTIFAPGVGIYGAKTKNGYEYLNGTSMAAPIVSGFIGLLKSENKNLSNGEIIKLLNSNSRQINNIPILNSKN